MRMRIVSRCDGDFTHGSIYKLVIQSSRTLTFYCLITLFIVSALSLTSCDSASETKHFADTYTQILMVREQTTDTAVANPRVDSILRANGYSKETFKSQFQELSRQPDVLRKMMDSVHTLVQKQGQK